MNKRNRIIIGYIFVLIGIFMPLIAFTSISFRELVANRNYENFKSKKPLMSLEIKNYNENIVKQGNNIIDPFENEDYVGDYNGLDKSKVFAYLLIPKLGLKKPVYLDASKEHLKAGLAQIEGTSLPIGGKSTRCVIAGHRGFWGDLMFYNIDQLESGDKIFIDGINGKLEYEVIDKEIISPSEWEKILPREGEDMLTLLSCHPKRPPRPKRLLVNAVRVKAEKACKNEINIRKAKKDIDKNGIEFIKSNIFLKYTIYIICFIGWLAFITALLNMLSFIRKKY